MKVYPAGVEGKVGVAPVASSSQVTTVFFLFKVQEMRKPLNIENVRMW